MVPLHNLPDFFSKGLCFIITGKKKGWTVQQKEVEHDYFYWQRWQWAIGKHCIVLFDLNFLVICQLGSGPFWSVGVLQPACSLYLLVCESRNSAKQQKSHH